MEANQHLYGAMRSLPVFTMHNSLAIDLSSKLMYSVEYLFCKKKKKKVCTCPWFIMMYN